MASRLHFNALLAPEGRRLPVERCETGPIAHVAEGMGISRATASKWANRYWRFGELGLLDRSSSPIRLRSATPGQLVKHIESMRCEHKWPASRITFEFNHVETPVTRCTTSRPLAQLGLNTRKSITPNGETSRRPQRASAGRPGRMVHLDVQKVERSPDGGGQRVHGNGSGDARAAARTRAHGVVTGCGYLHSATDGYSRLAHTEALSDGKAVTTVAFLGRAKAWFASHGITRIERVVTHDGSSCRATTFRGVVGSNRHQRIGPRTPRQKGEFERCT